MPPPAELQPNSSPNSPNHQPYFIRPEPPHRNGSLRSPEVQAYLKKHRWVKAWHDRTTKSNLKSSDDKRAGSVPRAPNEIKDLRHPRYCDLYLRENYRFKDKLPCPAMAMRGCSPETVYICESCLVFLHLECHAFFHQHHAGDPMPF
jgi:hypothetical protein